jgi:hypothetical protein
MANTTNYVVRLLDNAGKLRPISDWNYLVNIVDLNLWNVIKQWGDRVITGFEPSYASMTVTVGAGDGFAGGAYIVATGPQSIVIPDGLLSGTYTVYLSSSDVTTGEFEINYIAGADAAPINTVPVMEVDILSDAITDMRDLRTYIPTMANHDHTGGSQGPQLIDAAIADGANIAGSKLNLSNYISDVHIAGNAAITFSKINAAAAINNSHISATAAIAYSKLNLTGQILNADIGSAAAIAYSKLALTNSILNADISSAAAIAYSKLNLTGSVLRADLASGAAKVVIQDEGTTQRSDVNTLNFVGTGVSVSTDSGGVTTVTCNGGSGVLQISELADVEVIDVEDRQVLRYDDTDSRWENEDLYETIVVEETINIEADETKTLVFTHTEGDWGHPPVPQCEWDGDTVEAFLDLGQAFSNTQFALKIRNLTCYNPTGQVVLRYTRKGPKL